MRMCGFVFRDSSLKPSMQEKIWWCQHQWACRNVCTRLLSLLMCKEKEINNQCNFLKKKDVVCHASKWNASYELSPPPPFHA